MISKKEETDKTIEVILEGIKRIKGKEITIIDLNTIHHTECGYFIICHGSSNTQVNAISQSVEEIVEKQTGIKAWHRDGYKNAIWILIDYGEIMVHVFQKEAREFYNLEGLWADAKITKIEAEN
ncbi:MAG: ribosome silencing factor [Prolixibacteraceae bacterium]|nr:ribosome silencing factor [Prolixibacteraceae bacterium]